MEISNYSEVAVVLNKSFTGGALVTHGRSTITPIGGAHHSSISVVF